MKLLITAGPTREPIDPVRFISNRSSGQLGQALVGAAVKFGHQVTAIFGPVSLNLAPEARHFDVETSREMYQAVMEEFPSHDVLIMAAAVADFRPRNMATQKIDRSGSITLELEVTEDIVAAAAQSRKPTQRVIGFALEAEGSMERARAKLARKHLDMMVYNPLGTMNSPRIRAMLLFPDGTSEALPELSKPAFADLLIQKAASLLPLSI